MQLRLRNFDIHLSMSIHNVGQVTRPSVREHETKSAKTSILDAFCVCEWITWGVDEG